MKKRGDWLKARREELKKIHKSKFSVRAVADRIDITGSGLSHLENSDAMPTLDLAFKLAHELGRPVEWILTGVGGDDRRGIPVIGTTLSGPDLELLDVPGGITQFVDIDVRDANLYGLIVKGDTSLPQYSEGDVLVADKRRAPETGEDVVVVTKSGGLPVIRVLASQRDSTVYLDSFNDRSQRVIRDLDDILFIHPVVCVAKSFMVKAI